MCGCTDSLPMMLPFYVHSNIVVDYYQHHTYKSIGFVIVCTNTYNIGTRSLKYLVGLLEVCER